MDRDNETSHSPAPELPDRLLFLDRGTHEPNEDRACVMEAASWLAGEPWSDHPQSVHPVIALIARMTNDALDDNERQRLWPLVLASLGTARPRRFWLQFRLSRAARGADCASSAAWESLLVLHARLVRLPLSEFAISSLKAAAPIDGVEPLVEDRLRRHDRIQHHS